MKVKELIERLQKEPQDVDVTLFTLNGIYAPIACQGFDQRSYSVVLEIKYGGELEQDNNPQVGTV